jgi:hypothetical protein
MKHVAGANNRISTENKARKIFGTNVHAGIVGLTKVPKSRTKDCGSDQAIRWAN